MSAHVVAVCAKPEADGSIRKPQLPAVELVVDHGVRGDRHAGGKPDRQVLVMAAEILDAFNADGIPVAPGDMGENVVLRGIDLMALAPGTRIRLGETAEIRLTKERTPCKNLHEIDRRLLRASAGRAGMMAAVVAAGTVRPGDPALVLE